MREQTQGGKNTHGGHRGFERGSISGLRGFATEFHLAFNNNAGKWALLQSPTDLTGEHEQLAWQDSTFLILEFPKPYMRIYSLALVLLKVAKRFAC
jgi:hypothetical protein